jgi:hypothetical protein
MARIWIEPYERMNGPPWYWVIADKDHVRAPSLVPKNVLMVSAASFTFHFFSIQQVRDCLAYYERKTHPTSRLSIGPMDHWEPQRWFERLPMYLLEEPKREKVLIALKRALKIAELGAFSKGRKAGRARMGRH